MNTKVTFNGDGTVKEIKVIANEPVAYATLNGGGAYITTVYPYEGCEGVSTDQVRDIKETLEELPFVEYAKFNYDP